MNNVLNMPVAIEKAIANVIISRATWETVNEADRLTKHEILSKHIFREEDSHNRITEVNSDFLMSKADFAKYGELVYARNCEKGFDSGSPELTFWPIQKAVYNAEDVLIDAIAADIPEYTPDVVKAVKSSPKQRDKFFAILGL